MAVLGVFGCINLAAFCAATLYTVVPLFLLNFCAKYFQTLQACETYIPAGLAMN
jgi:hypothetical protein